MTTIASAADIHQAYRRRESLGPERLETLVAMHDQLMEAAAAHIDLGWRPAGGENLKWRYPLDADRLRRFADFAYGGLGFEFKNDFLDTKPTDDDPAPEVQKTEQLVLTARRRILNSIDVGATEARVLFADLEIQWAALLHEPLEIGGVFLDLVSASPPIRVTNQTTRVSNRAPLLAAWLGRAPTSVLEIGGGHGRFLRDCALLFPQARLVLTDLPFNLIVQARYLEEYFGGAVNLCLVDGQAFDPDARINLVAPWRLNEITVETELIANFLSFQHMDAVNLAWYGDAMDALAVRYLFPQNRSVGRDSFDFGVDDYPFRAKFTALYRESTPWATVVQPDGRRKPVDIVRELAVRRD